MPGRIQIPENNTLPLTSGSIIPASVRHSGEANVHELFGSTSKRETYMTKEVNVTHFRGLKFVGQSVKPENHNVYVLNKEEVLVAGETDEEVTTSNHYEAIAKLNELILYGHDSLPSSNDKWLLANEWVIISRIIHSP